jgi:hypothetical protein
MPAVALLNSNRRIHNVVEEIAELATSQQKIQNRHNERKMVDETLKWFRNLK